jgi:hypothetical protein
VKHETPSGQFIELVNARCAQGHSYESSWQFVRTNNPSLYERMKTEGAPKVNLANSADASEIERLRAVIARESKVAVGLANSLMERCAYTFERAWAETKILNKDVHARIADAQKRVMSLTNAKPDPTAAAPGGPAVLPVDYRLVEADLKAMPEAAFADERAFDLLAQLTKSTSSGTAELQRDWVAHASELPASAYAALLDSAAERGASLFDGDKGRAREAVAQKFPNIAQAAKAGVTPKPDAGMAKLFGVAA